MNSNCRFHISFTFLCTHAHMYFTFFSKLSVLEFFRRPVYASPAPPTAWCVRVIGPDSGEVPTLIPGLVADRTETTLTVGGIWNNTSLKWINKPAEPLRLVRNPMATNICSDIDFFSTCADSDDLYVTLQ